MTTEILISRRKRVRMGSRLFHECSEANESSRTSTTYFSHITKQEMAKKRIYWFCQYSFLSYIGFFWAFETELYFHPQQSRYAWSNSPWKTWSRETCKKWEIRRLGNGGSRNTLWVKWKPPWVRLKMPGLSECPWADDNVWSTWLVCSTSCICSSKPGQF